MDRFISARVFYGVWRNGERFAAEWKKLPGALPGKAARSMVPAGVPSDLYSTEPRCRSWAKKYAAPLNTFTAGTIGAFEQASIAEIKDNYFGTTDKWAREFAFRYSILADFIGSSADDLGATGTDNLFSHGRVNANHAVDH